MKISHFLAKIWNFGSHFEFSNFSGIKRHRRLNILTDWLTPNLAMETTYFIPDLQKNSDIPNPTFESIYKCIHHYRRNPFYSPMSKLIWRGHSPLYPCGWVSVWYCGPAHKLLRSLHQPVACLLLVRPPKQRRDFQDQQHYVIFK